MRFFLFIILGFINISLGQTTQWTLTWDKNPEPDMFRYRVFRGETALPTQMIAEVSHPDTSYTDTQIEKGKQYFYRLKAVDFAQLESGFSEVVSAAVPLIQFPDTLESVVLAPGQDFTLDLDQFVSDPDGGSDQLTWSHEGAQNLEVSINQSQKTALISAPVSWSGWERIGFIAADPDGFADRADIVFVSDSTIIPPTPESTDDIRAYPVPFAVKQHRHLGGITFINLPENGTLKIYTMLGEPVYYNKNYSDGKFLWNLKNSKGNWISPGVYIYMAFDKDNKKKKSGKLVVVK